VRAQGHCSVFRFTLIKKGGRKKRELFIEIEEKKEEVLEWRRY